MHGIDIVKRGNLGFVPCFLLSDRALADHYRNPYWFFGWHCAAPKLAHVIPNVKRMPVAPVAPRSALDDQRRLRRPDATLISPPHTEPASTVGAAFFRQLPTDNVSKYCFDVSRWNFLDPHNKPASGVLFGMFEEKSKRHFLF